MKKLPESVQNYILELYARAELNNTEIAIATKQLHNTHITTTEINAIIDAHGVRRKTRSELMRIKTERDNERFNWKSATHSHRYHDRVFIGDSQGRYAPFVDDRRAPVLPSTDV